MKRDIVPWRERKELARRQQEQDEIIEGKIIEDKSIIPVGRGSGFRSELAQAAKETNTLTGYPITPTDQHWLDAVDARIAQREEQEKLDLQKKQQSIKQDKPGFLSRLFGSGSGKKYSALVKLPDGSFLEAHSKEEETAIIKAHWR